VQDLDKTTTFHIFLTAAVCAGVAALSAGLWLVMFKYFARQLIYLSIGFSVLFTAAIAVFSFIYGAIIFVSHVRSLCSPRFSLLATQQQRQHRQHLGRRHLLHLRGDLGSVLLVVEEPHPVRRGDAQDRLRARAELSRHHHRRY
jgi:hypothetical protein